MINTIKYQKFGTFGDKLTDNDEEKLRHKFLIYMGTLMSSGGLLWGGIASYYGLHTHSLIPFGYTFLTILNFIFFYISKNFVTVRFFQVLISLLLPFFFQWSLGGFIQSGAMMLWSTLAIVGSLTFAGARSNVKWLVIYLLLTIVTGFIDGFVKPYGIETPPTVTTVFFVINIVITSSIVFGLTIFLLERREQANHDLEELLEKVEQKVEERTKELQIKNTQLENLSSKLAKYLSPQVYDLIFSGTKEVKIETYRKKLTVFFSDIVGFTELTDQMESEPLATLLNNYLNEMSEIALRHGGTIDKFIGDAVMVFFGDPDTKGEKEDAIACTLMAFEMRERMKYLSKYWGEQGISKPLQIRIGINSGFCTVGNFGSENRLDYTIVGGQVNLASRLETNAKPGQILISHETYALVKDKVICEEKEDIQVKGISSAIQTYQVLDLRRKETTEKFVIKDEHDGYSLSININRANKDLVVDSLRGALQEMDSHIQDKNTTNKSI